jgi:peroxiredoxin
MTIQTNQSAPAFSIKDVNGTTVNLSDLKGKKVLLNFYRNAGCPACNFRFHELEKQSANFKAKGLVVISVYESSSENLNKYLSNTSRYSIMIPNPSQDLYAAYSVERSMGKMMKGMFNGAMGKMNKGQKLFTEKIKQDGNMDRIGAEFLIDEDGKILISHYGKFLGDHLSIETILNTIK